ncbi:hypothetical protein, partial [Halonotius pteroides]
MTDRKDSWPTSGYSIDPHNESKEFEMLKEAVENFIEPELPEGATSIERALARILWEDRRDRFAEAHGLDGVADKACIARLIDDDLDECPHGHASSHDSRMLHHKPPAADHSTLWLDDNNDPALYSMHVYSTDLDAHLEDKPHSRWFDIVGWARENRLDVQTRNSWYNPSTTQIIFQPMDDPVPEYPDTPELWHKQEWQEKVRAAYEKADDPPVGVSPNLTTKTINDRDYHYLQWRDGDSVVSQYVAPVI